MLLLNTGLQRALLNMNFKKVHLALVLIDSGVLAKKVLIDLPLLED